VDHTFGDEALNKVVDTIKQNLGNPVTVNVLRKNIVMGTVQNLEFNYTPREWDGRGFLGCVLKCQPL
jgi:hypothetical protein